MATRDERVPSTKGFSLSGPSTPLPELVRGIWDSRRLLTLLSRKEFFVRYRRASFGVVWALVLPLLQAIVLAIVVSRFVTFDTNGNFTLFVFAGTLAWSFFSQTITGGTTSIVDNADMSARSTSRARSSRWWWSAPGCTAS
jgi:ABC-type polysaccharide/polyol phosphate export permease